MLDVVVSSCIAIRLWRKQTGWSTSDRVIKKIAVLSAEAQLTPTLAVIAFAIVLFVAPQSNLANGFLFAAKLPVCAVLAVLSARRGLRVEMEQPVLLNVFNPPVTYPGAALSRTNAVLVEQETLVTESVDPPTNTLHVSVNRGPLQPTYLNYAEAWASRID